MSFLLNRKLKRWVEASLITEETALKIQAHETAGSGTNVMHAALGIGALTIVTGIVSIIAANWELIPSYLKLLSNFSWLTALAIALAWAVIFLSSSRYAAWAWGVSMAIWALQVQDRFTPVDNAVPYGLLIILYVGMALNFFRLKNFHFARETFRGGLILLAGYIFSIGSMAWVTPMARYKLWDSVISVGLLVPVLLFIGKYQGRHLAGLFTAGMAYAFIPQSFLHPRLEVTGAVLFILLCTAVAHYAVRIQHKKLFELSCLVIAFRIIVIYFEVFGSLLETGFGLIGSGTFIIFIVWLWNSGRGRFWRNTQ